MKTWGAGAFLTGQMFLWPPTQQRQRLEKTSGVVVGCGDSTDEVRACVARWLSEFCRSGATSTLRRWSATTLPPFCRSSIQLCSTCPSRTGTSRSFSLRSTCCDTCTTPTERCMKTSLQSIVTTFPSTSLVLRFCFRLFHTALCDSVRPMSSPCNLLFASWYNSLTTLCLLLLPAGLWHF